MNNTKIRNGPWGTRIRVIFQLFKILAFIYICSIVCMQAYLPVCSGTWLARHSPCHWETLCAAQLAADVVYRAACSWVPSGLYSLTAKPKTFRLYYGGALSGHARDIRVILASPFSPSVTRANPAAASQDFSPWGVPLPLSAGPFIKARTLCWAHCCQSEYMPLPPRPLSLRTYLGPEI